MIDLHSHILAGVDDGARTLDESLAIARAAADSGVELMAATPHVRADFPTTAETMERLVEETRNALRAEGIEVELRGGGEVALDFLPRLGLGELRRFGLAGNPRYVLLEFPYEGWPLGLETVVASLREEGITVVLAHPERSESVQVSPLQLLPVVTEGALVQLTASSLAGGGGRSARQAADSLLELELAHLVAGDLHAPGARSGLDAAAEALGHGALARWLTHDVPFAIAHDEPLPPPPRTAGAAAVGSGSGATRLARMLPKRFPDRVEIAAVRAAAERAENGETLDDELRVAGRVMGRRELGKLTFLDLVDRSGRIQLIVEQQLELSLGDIVGATGRPGRSRRGEPSLVTSQVELLAKIRKPLPDTFHGVTDRETRYRQRYLDLLMNEESRQLAATRTKIVAAVRGYLDGAGFLEVETPILQPRYGGGFAEPFVTHSNELDADLYLRIADELYLKRLIVGGLEKVYELGKDFRNESISYKHSPEFTQVEWYEAYADYRDTMERAEALVAAAADAAGSRKVTFRGHELDLSPPWERVRFVDALESKGVWSRDIEELRAKLEEAGVDTERDRSWSQLADHAYSHFVEPELIQPTIVYDWPIELSPFARTTDGDETLVERFEAVVGGMEFANAFSELNDAEEQAQRFAMQEAEREAGAEESEPGDPDYVEALSYGMPPTGGCGIGIDRLAMVLTGSDAIRDVILFPALRSR